MPEPVKVVLPFRRGHLTFRKTFGSIRHLLEPVKVVLLFRRGQLALPSRPLAELQDQQLFHLELQDVMALQQ